MGNVYYYLILCYFPQQKRQDTHFVYRHLSPFDGGRVFGEQQYHYKNAENTSLGAPNNVTGV